MLTEKGKTIHLISKLRFYYCELCLFLSLLYCLKARSENVYYYVFYREASERNRSRGAVFQHRRRS